MKTKTIDVLIYEIDKKINIAQCENLLETIKVLLLKEKQRKEQRLLKNKNIEKEAYERGRMDGFNELRSLLNAKNDLIKELQEKIEQANGLNWFSKIINENNLYLDENGNIKPRATQLSDEVNGYSLTAYGKVIINDGEKFKQLLDKLNEAYNSQCEIKNEITIDKSRPVIVNLMNKDVLFSRFEMDFESMKFERLKNNSKEASVKFKIHLVE